ncbi:MAG TPA: ATP-binding cassette domain-containing protein [Acetobacteraceae bacterium]|nr:ATP-binding cassette domain-containing protein [Acetobacteraceae bacterium]
MASPSLLLQDIRLSLGSAPLLGGAEIGVAPGEHICLVGRNGSGKSTLLKIAAGMIEPDSGTRFLQPGTTVRYLPQEPDLAGFPTVLDYVEAGLDPGDAGHQARNFLDQLGLTGAEDPASLSGGEVRRAALARVLAADPDLLLLDEPTNHLDLPAIEWLESALRTSRAAIVLISHDRRLLERVSRSIVWLDGGRTRRLDRGFAYFESWRDEVLEQEEREHHKLGRQIAREEDWMRYGVTARRKRNVRRVSELAALRQRRREERRPDAGLRIEASEAGISGKLVITAKSVSKAYGERVIVRDLTTRILRGDRLGIIGPNGAGKTTLLNLLTGTLSPDSGEIKLGTNLALITFDQTRASLNPAKTLADTLTGGKSDMVQVGENQRHVIGYMKDFLFRPEQARTPVGTLSGGERGRLLLAAALAKPSNLLVLDEPTNDLDLETLDLLQEMLADYPGTILLVSHDRDFLDRVATSTIAAEGDGRWIEYAGGYSDMLAQPGSRIPARRSPAPARAAASIREPAAAAEKPKFSFKDKHRLEQLTAEIERLQAGITTHQQALADADLFSRDAEKFSRITTVLAEAPAALDRAEEQWLELELRRAG